jgi:hypothetical protein
VRRFGKPTREEVAEAKAEYIKAIGSVNRVFDNILKTFDRAPRDEFIRIANLARILKLEMHKEQAYLALAVAIDRLAKTEGKR